MDLSFLGLGDDGPPPARRHGGSGGGGVGGGGALPPAVDVEPLEDYQCPITTEIMIDPVVTTDGFTYERAAITQWFTASNMSPTTGEPLASTLLTPNLTARAAIRSLLQRRPQLAPPGYWGAQAALGGGGGAGGPGRGGRAGGGGGVGRGGRGLGAFGQLGGRGFADV